MVDQAHFSGPTGSAEHITISYAGFTRPWAAWISHQLEQQGHGTTMLRWDPQADTALVAELSGLLAAEGRLLMVLDDWYFRLGPKTQDEWTAALREVVSPHADRFAAVSVATQSLPATASLLRPADLRDLDAHEANRRVLQRLGITAPGRTVDEDAPGAPRFPNNPPEVWNIPRRNNRFTGRDNVLEELHGKLAGSGAGAGPPLETRIALYGTSGVGKSQIAAEYAHRFGNDYDVVWWISATNRGAAREQLAELATPARPPRGPGAGRPYPRRPRGAARRPPLPPLAADLRQRRRHGTDRGPGPGRPRPCPDHHPHPRLVGLRQRPGDRGAALQPRRERRLRHGGAHRG